MERSDIERRSDGNSQVTSTAGTNMIMILETTSGGRSTGTDPLSWDGMMRYKYIQGQHGNTKGLLRSRCPI
jgi:hypothetical protein